MNDVKAALLRTLYTTGQSFNLHVATKGCQLPPHLYKEERQMFLIGARLRPTPVVYFEVDPDAVVTSLLFGTREEVIRVPYENVTAIEGPDSLHMFKDAPTVLVSVAPSKQLRTGAASPTLLKRTALRMIKGGRFAGPSDAPKGAA